MSSTLSKWPVLASRSRVDDNSGMRVTHLHSGNLYGGVETFLVTWMQASRQFTPDWQHRFLLGWEGAFSERLKALGIPYDVVPVPRFSRPWTLLGTRRAVAARLAEQGPDVVVAHGFWQANALLPSRVKSPVVLWMNDVLDRDHWLAWLVRSRQFNLVVTPSRLVTQQCADFLRADRFATVPYPVAKTEVTPRDRQAARAKLGAAPGERILLQVGRMQPWKGHQALLHAVAALRTATPWKLWVVGGAQNAEEQCYLAGLERMADELKISAKVKFWGQSRDVTPLYAAADLYCQLNAKPESFGIVFVEALRAGLPVVTHRLGGEVEIFSRVPGFLTSPDEPFETVRVLERLVDDQAFFEVARKGVTNADLSFCDPEVQSQTLARLLAGVARGRT